MRMIDREKKELWFVLGMSLLVFVPALISILTGFCYKCETWQIWIVLIQACVGLLTTFVSILSLIEVYTGKTL